MVRSFAYSSALGERRAAATVEGAFAATSAPGGVGTPLRTGRDKAEAVGPRQKGRFLGRRAKKPKQLAIILDGCTGCAGAPVCQTTCPVEDCMLLSAADDALPFGRIWVDPLKCVGCRKCVSDGPDESFLDGCPWDAIAMIATDQWEEMYGELAY